MEVVCQQRIFLQSFAKTQCSSQRTKSFLFSLPHLNTSYYLHVFISAELNSEQGLGERLVPQRAHRSPGVLVEMTPTQEIWGRAWAVISNNLHGPHLDGQVAEQSFPDFSACCSNLKSFKNHRCLDLTARDFDSSGPK